MLHQISLLLEEPIIQGVGGEIEGELLAFFLDRFERAVPPSYFEAVRVFMAQINSRNWPTICTLRIYYSSQ